LLLNAFSGFCSCPDYQVNGLCAHLLAAEQQYRQQHASMFAWSSDLLAPADADAPIPVQREIAAPRLPAGIQEPTQRFDPKGLVVQLRSAVAATRQQSKQRVLTETQKKVISAASSIVTDAKQVSDDDLLPLLQQLQQLQAKIRAAVPGFQQQRAQAKRTWARQLQDRKLKPLFPGRRKPRAQQVLEAALRTVRGQPKKKAGAKFKKQQESGRPRTTIRGRGNMVRGPGKGGLRPPRRNKHLPAAVTAEAAAAAAASQQQGRPSQRRQQKSAASASQQQSQQRQGSQEAGTAATQQPAQRMSRPPRQAAARQQEWVSLMVQEGLAGGDEPQKKKTKKK
jgi:hypothetical protein